MAGVKRPPLHALTGLRFLAAFHVVIFHFATRPLSSAPRLVHWLVRAGYIQVSLFFVLSGFVLTYSYADEAGEAGSLKSSWRDFWAARFARIYPLFVLAVVLGAPAYFGGLVERFGLRLSLVRALLSLIPTLLLMQAWTPITHAAWNGPGWSLSAEAFFYCLSPILISRIRCARVSKLFTAGALLFFAANLAPVSLQVAAGALDLKHKSISLLGTHKAALELAQSVVGFNPLLRLPEFVFGIFLGRYFLARSGEGGALRQKGAVITAASSLALLAALVVIGAHPDERYLFQNGFLLPLFGALIWGLAQGGGALGRFLSMKWMLVLGEASYAVYILQEPIWTLYRRFTLSEAARKSTSWSLGYFAVYAMILIGVSMLTYRYIEVPARTRLRRIFAAKAPKKVAIAA